VYELWHGIAFGVASLKVYHFNCAISPVEYQTSDKGQVGSTNLEDRPGLNDTHPQGKLTTLALVFRRLELCPRRFQVDLGIRHKRVVGAMPSCGDEHAAGLLGRDDVGVSIKDLVASDMVVVPVAIDDSVDVAAGQGFRGGSQVLSSLRGNEGVVNQWAVA
jgi:hypothetical protein